MRERVPFSAILLLIPTLAFAQSTDNWKRLVEDGNAALKKGDYQQSLAITKRLTTEMMALLGPGPAAEKAFATVVAMRALSEAGLGNDEDAAWYWRVAKSIHPPIAKLHLMTYGNAGAKLMKVNTRALETSGGASKSGGTVSAPVVRKRVEPVYPTGAQAFGTEGMLVLELVITPEGRVVYPGIKKALPAPTLSYAALEAVRQWQFEPGKLDGKPVPVIFNLTITYKR